MDDRKKKRRRMMLEIVLIAAALIIVVLLLREHTPKILKLLEDGNVSGIETYIKAEGEKGRFVLILLQVIETVTIVLPAMPVYICAGAVYGKLQGFLMCYLTNILMNILIFIAARKMKTSTLEFARFQKNQKLEELMTAAQHPERLVVAMCLLPIVPNGMIPYISAQTGIRPMTFTAALAVGSLPSILVYVCFGDLLLSEHFKITLPLVIIVAVLVIILMLFKKKITAFLEPKLKKLL